MLSDNVLKLFFLLEHRTVSVNLNKLTLNECFEVDMFSNRHVPDSPTWKLQSEQMGVVVDLSLRHQHTVPIVESCKKEMIDKEPFHPFIGFPVCKETSSVIWLKIYIEYRLLRKWLWLR